MNPKILAFTVAICSLGVAALADTQVANHLVLSEINIASPSGYGSAPESTEYVELYNPTNAEVDLSKYYLTDYKLYFELPAFVSLNTNNQLSGGSDWLLQFPAGSKIPAGGTVVVTNNASKFYELFFHDDKLLFTNQPGNPQLFETTESDASVPNMISYNKSDANYPLPVNRDLDPIAANGQNLSHTDAGEFTVLFYWDGVGAYVKDVDIVSWRPSENPWGSSEDQFPTKSGYPAVGPNGESGAYPMDGGGVANLDIDYISARKANAVRRTIVEAGEPVNTAPGATNGYTGHDESMELCNLTWEMVWGYPQSASPGIVPNLGRTTDDHAPVIGKPTRDIKNPAPGNNVTITCPVYGVAPFTVNLMVKKGTGNYVAQPMTASGSEFYTATIATAGIAEGTHVEWYVTATKGTKTSTEADFISQETRANDYRLNHTFTVKSTPYTSTDLLVSEIMLNPQGTNNTTHIQYFEVYNPSNTALDMSSFYWTIDYADGSNNETVPQVVRMPDGAIVPPHGYAVITARKEKFLRNYPGMNQVLVGDADLSGGAAFIPYAGAPMYFMDANQYDFDENPVDPATAAFKVFTYQNNKNGWPDASTAASPAADKGYAMELRTLNPGDDNLGANWGIGTVYNGTPMAANSLNVAVHPGNIEVTNLVRVETYPLPNTSITIKADAVSTNGIDPNTGVKVYYTTGGAYTAAPMTLETGNTFVGALPGFADGSIVKFYIEVTDLAVEKGYYPFTAPVNIVPFRVDANPQQLKDSLVINEVMYDPYGSDNGSFPEYVEFYNKGNVPIDLSYFQYGTNTTMRLNDGNVNTFPEGTVLQPGEYFVVAGQRWTFTDQYMTPYPSTLTKYGVIKPENFAQAGWNFAYTSTGSTLANGNGRFHVAHINDVDFYGLAAANPFIDFSYQVTAPWPANGVAIDRYSIELKNPNLDIMDPTNWAVTLEQRGTPGVKNSTYVASSAVNDWALF